MPPTVHQLASPTDPTSDSLAAAHPSATLFQGSAWARVLQETYRYDPVYLVLRDGANPLALLPMMGINSWLTGKRGVSLPFTDECPPLVSDSESFGRLYTAAQNHGRLRGWKYLEFRGGRNWFENTPHYVPSTSYWGHRLLLLPDELTLFARVNSSVRRAIRKAEQNNLQVEVSTSLAAMEAFYGLMCQTRQRHGVPPQPWSFFANIHKYILKPGYGCIVLARASPATVPPRENEQADFRVPNSQNTRSATVPMPCNPQVPSASGSEEKSSGKAIAGAVFLHSGKTASYKFGASDELQQHLRANNLVMWNGIKWHAQHGFTSLDFGRTSLDNEGLRRFKLGWGTEENRIDYTKLDIASGRYVTARDQASGWHTKIFQKMPVPLARLVGTALYRHVA